MDTEQLLAAQAAVIKSREMRIAELEAEIATLRFLVEGWRGEGADKDKRIAELEALLGKGRPVPRHGSGP